MARSARIIALLLAATCLAACTTDRLAPGEAAGIRSVHLAPLPEPKRYDVNVFAAPGTGVRIGAYDAVLANDIQRAPDPGDIDARLTQTLTEEAGLRLGAELVNAIEAALRETGHEITDDAASSDATLTVTPLFAGYVDQPLRPYTPLLIVEITLRARADGHTLFRQRYTFSRLPYLADDIHLVPDPRYTFEDEAALLADPARAAEGLRTGLALIAAHVETTLR